MVGVDNNLRYTIKKKNQLTSPHPSLAYTVILVLKQEQGARHVRYAQALAPGTP